MVFASVTATNSHLHKIAKCGATIQVDMSHEQSTAKIQWASLECGLLVAIDAVHSKRKHIEDSKFTTAAATGWLRWRSKIYTNKPTTASPSEGWLAAVVDFILASETAATLGER